MTEENKYPYLSETMKKIYSDALKGVQNGEFSVEGVLDVFYEHLNNKYQENDKLVKQLENSKERTEFLESFLVAVFTKYLKEKDISDDDRAKFLGDLENKLLK